MKNDKIFRYALIASGALTLIICAVMNFCLFPIIESTTQGIRAFDMNSFGYTFAQAKQFVSHLDERGLSTYLHIQLPLDFIYPIAYTTFFSLAILKLKKDRRILLIFPALLMVSDYIENIFSIRMLKTDFMSSVAEAASKITVMKSVLMYITIIIVLVLFIQWIIKKSRKKDTAKKK